MKKSEFKLLCENYHVNRNGMKAVLRSKKLRSKDIDTQQFLETLQLNLGRLLWSRSDGKGFIEYLDDNHLMQVIVDLDTIKKKVAGF